MFFFFFNEIYYKPAVKLAFQKVCLDKMLSDGYFDMRMYIFALVKKEEMGAALTQCKSRYAVLYRNAYPKKENILQMWDKYFGNDFVDNAISELRDIEAKAIVNWVYRAFNNDSEREEATKRIFEEIKDLHEIRNDIRFSAGVVYNNAKVDVHFISAITEMNSVIALCKASGKQLFFRGHSNSNYILQPSVFRSRDWRENERAMYNELLIECPEDFEKCHTHLEKLVEMQHYGLPTRLLDITRNPMVALYFACEREPDSYGEVILIAANSDDIKYPQSDTISILASLPQFTYEKQLEIFNLANDPAIDNVIFNANVTRLLHEVRLEKPAFQAEIIKKDVLRNFIVYALKNNSRIVKQDGAFILCGLLNEQYNLLNKFRYKDKGKTVVLLIDKKKEILEQLNILSINHAKLFPEIECVSEYIKTKYSVKS